jgi:hypothetical protein
VFALASGSGGARHFYRESILQAGGGGPTVETNLHNITGANGSLIFSLGTGTVTVQATTSAGVSESGFMAIELIGQDMGASRVTVL